MSPKFNQPIPARTPDTRTAEGGEGFSRNAKDELFLLGIANMVGEETFYESCQTRDDRFEKLVHEVIATDEKWMIGFIGWLRSEANMRSAPIVAAAEYVRAGGSGGRQVVASVLKRPDEPGELLGYWLGKYGRKIPQPIKRGIADSLGRLYTERNVLKYDGSGNAIRFGDIVDLVHPTPAAAWQSSLYKHVIDRRHGHAVEYPEGLPLLATDIMLQKLPTDVRRAHLPQAIACGWSWERTAGWLPGGMDAEAWEAVAPNMGLMSLTRNLRGLDQAGISDKVAHTITGRFLDPEEVKRSRQFPLRFLTAWKAVASMRWGMALEGALNLSLANVPALPGRTLVLVDVSPSMRDVALSKRTDGRADPAITPRRWEVAGVFGAAIAQRAAHADVVLFDYHVMSKAQIKPAESVLRFVEQCGQFANNSNGTDILRALAESYQGHDRVVILTDEQTGYLSRRASWGNWGGAHLAVMGDRYGWADVEHIRCPVHTFNLGGFKTGVTPNERNWHTFGGLTDACFRLIPILEGRHKDAWPWDFPETIQAPQEMD